MSNTGKKHTFDWERIVYLMNVSRSLDNIEETELVPQKKVLYQFSARGHDFAQIILGSLLTHKADAASGYYRSRPLMLTLGLSLIDAFGGPLGRVGGFSGGRDIGVVCNLPNLEGPKVLPMAGGVGTQYTPAAGWAQALRYKVDTLNEQDYERAISVALGGEGSVATNGFWSALNIASVNSLPMLFYIEDNGYGLSVPSSYQTPGGDFLKNIQSYQGIYLLDGDGTEPAEACSLLEEGISHIRAGAGPALVRLKVPRLSGHSGQDTQAYKSEKFLEEERAKDPLPKLKRFLVESGFFTEARWSEIETQVEEDVRNALEQALKLPEPDPETLYRHVFSEENEAGEKELQLIGGLATSGHSFPQSSEKAAPEGQRINMLTAIRKTMQSELATNPKLLVFGEDVGKKGGVHAATLGLQEEFGEARVFDTSLSEEGIIGRALGMAMAGLMPVAEIQFRKYADPAQEQLTDCGTIRWRTENKFAAPIVVRVPGGFAKCGDPWHSVSDEVMFAHLVGWQVAYPSNAEDAVGLLRSAMRANDPTLFFEHRNLLDAVSARKPYPGDQFVVPFGRGKVLRIGEKLTVITWGAMVERALEAAAQFSNSDVEVIDLRTIMPWDRELVFDSVVRTGRALIVHEDQITAGFGAEVAAFLSREAFFALDAPIERLAVKDIPIPYNVGLLNEAVPSVPRITQSIADLLEF